MEIITVSGARIRREMRMRKITIRQLAATLNVTLKRVRYVRENGVSGNSVFDYAEALTGEPRFFGGDWLSPEDRAIADAHHQRA